MYSLQSPCNPKSSSRGAPAVPHRHAQSSKESEWPGLEVNKAMVYLVMFSFLCFLLVISLFNMAPVHSTENHLVTLSTPGCDVPCGENTISLRHELQCCWPSSTLESTIYIKSGIFKQKHMSKHVTRSIGTWPWFPEECVPAFAGPSAQNQHEQWESTVCRFLVRDSSEQVPLFGSKTTFYWQERRQSHLPRLRQGRAYITAMHTSGPRLRQCRAYVSAVRPRCLGGQWLDSLPIELSCTTVVLGVGVAGGTTMLMEEGWLQRR